MSAALPGDNHVSAVDATVGRVRRRRRRMDRIWRPAAYLAPTLILLGIFDVYPIFLAAWISLWRWGIRAERFIGLTTTGASAQS